MAHQIELNIYYIKKNMIIYFLIFLLIKTEIKKIQITTKLLCKIQFFC